MARGDQLAQPSDVEIEQPRQQQPQRIDRDPRLARAAGLGLREHARIAALCGRGVYERYGLTETLINCAVPVSGPPQPGSVGPPLSGVELRLVDVVTHLSPDRRHVDEPDAVEHAEMFGDGLAGDGQVGAETRRRTRPVVEEQVEQQVDKDKAAKLAEKVAKGKKFDLNDMRDQLEQMQNMGGIGGLMDKLPGLGNIPDHLKQQVSQGKEVPRMIAIISSMTRKERRNPNLLNGSRRARIAKGSGVTPADVNKLMKQYMQMEKMMSKMAGGGMKGMLRSMKGMMGAMGGRGMPFR